MSFVVKRATDRTGDATRADLATTTGVGARAGPAEPAGAVVGDVGRADNFVVDGTGVDVAGAMLGGAVVVGTAVVASDVVVAVAVSLGGTTAAAPVPPPVPPPGPTTGGAVVVVVDAPSATVVVVVVVVVTTTLVPVARAFITLSSASGGRLLYGWSALSERTVTTPA